MLQTAGLVKHKSTNNCLIMIMISLIMWFCCAENNVNPTKSGTRKGINVLQLYNKHSRLFASWENNETPRNTITSEDSNYKHAALSEAGSRAPRKSTVYEHTGHAALSEAGSRTARKATVYEHTGHAALSEAGSRAPRKATAYEGTSEQTGKHVNSSGWRKKRKVRQRGKDRKKRGWGQGDGFMGRTEVKPSRCICPHCVNDSAVYENVPFENVAYNKPGRSSSFYGKHAGYCGAVNGDTNSVLTDRNSGRPNCFFGSQAAQKMIDWWTVDLQYFLSFIRVHVVMNSRYVNIADMLISIDGQECHQTASNASSESQSLIRPFFYGFACKKLLTGRYIHIEKHPPFEQRSKIGYSYNLSFCEVQVWVCKPGTYGLYPASCMACTQCKYTCNNWHGCKALVLYNVAIRKYVYASSVGGGSVNDLTDVNIYYYSSQGFYRRCMLTYHDSADEVATHWITVDLAASFKVFRVVMRVSEKFLRFSVLITDSDAEKLQENVAAFTCRSMDSSTNRAENELICTKPLYGRYVTVIKTDTAALSVCKLRVLGHPVYHRLPGGQCSNYSEINICAKGSVCASDGICKLTKGANCFNSQFCLQGLTCVNNICSNPLAKLNEACGGETLCESGLICFRGVCKRLRRSFSEESKTTKVSTVTIILLVNGIGLLLLLLAMIIAFAVKTEKCKREVLKATPSERRASMGQKNELRATADAPKQLAPRDSGGQFSVPDLDQVSDKTRVSSHGSTSASHFSCTVESCSALEAGSAVGPNSATETRSATDTNVAEETGTATETNVAEETGTAT